MASRRTGREVPGGLFPGRSPRGSACRAAETTGSRSPALKDAYRAHSREIDAAVRRRVAKGSIEPVMLREFDLRVEPAEPSKPRD
ncbi:MAG: hypothetical protein E6H79_06575 [Betaproteobacteria bacterium]|nr:MAG: hypothetical protein E6H79_06575 [Betaproteobacteria bacterium]